MKLILIYGPPGVGKYTVAKKLQKLIGYKLFHNHLINDVLSQILDKINGDFWDVSNDLKLRTIEAAAKLKVKGVIYTTVYAKTKKGDKEPAKLKKAVEKHKGKVYYVRLKCDKEILEKRLQKRSRKKLGKLRDVKELRKFAKKYNLNQAMKFKDQLEIDNTKLSARKVARQIKEHYKLR